MTDAALSSAIRSAVEVQGTGWSGRSRVGTPDGLADQLLLALAAAPDMTETECVAAMVGESAQETDWFCSLVEYGGSSSRYAPYYGRGCIQLTWETNYRGFGQWLYSLGALSDPEYFVNNPDAVTVWPFPWLCTVYYFVRHIDAGYWRAKNWNAISGLINAGSASYYVSAYQLRANSCNAALAQLANWAYQGETDMQLSDTVKRPDGHEASLNDVLAYMDMRLEKLESIVCGRGVPYAGGVYDGESTDVQNEVAWAAYNFKVVNDLVSKVGEVAAGAATVDDLKKLLAEIVTRTNAEDGSVAAADSTVNRYVVASGETLKQIAETYGRTVAELLAANPAIGDGNSLKSGDVLVLP